MKTINLGRRINPHKEVMRKNRKTLRDLNDLDRRLAAAIAFGHDYNKVLNELSEERTSMRSIGQ